MPLTSSEQLACATTEVREATAAFTTKDDDGNDLSGEPAIRYIFASGELEA